MIMTFATVLAWILFVGITLWVGGIFVAFVQLPVWQQRRATITIGAPVVLAWVASLAWIITQYIS